MITITEILIAGKKLTIKEHPTCLNRIELEYYRWELWADHCREQHIAFSKEDAHNAVLMIHKETKP